MKKFLLLVIIILSNLALYSQGLSVFDVETTNFPIIKAKFFAFDNKGNQITNLSASDFDLKENGTARKITNVSCPVPKPSQSVSIGMSLDNSGSMGSPTGSSPLAFGKATAKRLAEQMTIPPSEIAVQSCDDKAIIWTDFTKDKSKYFTSVERVPGGGNNDFVEQLLNQRTGILNIVKTGNLKRIAVLYTDAYWPALTTGELQRCKDTCGKYNISFYAIVYSTPYAEPNGIKSSLKALAEATNGKLYDGVTSLSTVEDLATELQSLVQGGDPCTIEWESGKICKAGLINVELMITPLNISTSAAYNSPDIAEQKLEFTPKTIRFKNAIPGIKTDSMITVTAKNGNFTVTNIVSSDPEFTISPTSFTLNAGQSMNLTLSVVPTDSGYTYCQYSLENDKCPTNYAASTGFKGKKLKTRTLQLLKPNGGEVFLAGTDTIISWEGVLPDEAIKIEFTKNNGANWMVLSDSATGLSYNWKVPKLPGNQCLVRISAKISQNLTVYDNESVQIGRQIWMGYNLDVDRYRNGDSIPEIRNVNTWDSSYVHQIGAWSNCKNEPERGAEYGNLYNWFAVADKRNLAPEGWHIPSENEWDELINYLGGKYEAGWKLMEAGTVHWKSPNGYATNETGFSALPGGFIDVRYNYCDHLHEKGYWWSSTGGGEYVAVVIMSYDFTLLFGPFENYFPYSVRCVKDTLSKTDYQLQYDQSDFVFSIVSPAVASIDVDMKECLLGSTKDSVISSYLTNTGTYPCRIDSIFFTGADSAAFSMISGKPPFIIDTGKSKPVEFHFVPVRTGIHQAKINIITQADTLHQNISGTGVEQKNTGC